MVKMSYHLSVIRELILAAFGDEELTSFCFDHFRDVFNQFASGQTKGARVLNLVDYVSRKGLLEELLMCIREANPYQYDLFAPRLSKSYQLPERKLALRDFRRWLEGK